MPKRRSSLQNFELWLSERKEEFNKLYIERQLSNNILHFAVASNSLISVRKILRQPDFNVFAKNEEGKTALFIALESNCSIDLIELLVKSFPKLINIPSHIPYKNKIYPINEAIRNENGLLITKMFIETAKEHEIDIKDRSESELFRDSCLFIATKLNKFEILRYLLENTTFYTRFETKRINLLKNSMKQSENRISEFILDFLFAHQYGDLSNHLQHMLDLIWDFIDVINDQYYLNWLVEKFYLHKSNNLRSIVMRVQNTEKIQLTNRNSIILFLYSNDENQKLNDINAPMSDRLNDFYENLFEIFLIEQELFNDIIVNFKNQWVDRENRIHDARFLKNVLSEANLDDIDESLLIEFFDKINLENWNGSKEYKIVPNLSKAEQVKLFMPFMAVTSSEGILGFRADRKRINLSEDSIKSKQRDVFNPLALQQYCRSAVRRTVFEANNKLSNAKKLRKLKALKAPTALKNFIFYNESEYNMFKSDKN